MLFDIHRFIIIYDILTLSTSDPCSCLTCWVYRNVRFFGCVVAATPGHPMCVVSLDCPSPWFYDGMTDPPHMPIIYCNEDGNAAINSSSETSMEASDANGGANNVSSVVAVRGGGEVLPVLACTRPRWPLARQGLTHPVYPQQRLPWVASVPFPWSKRTRAPASTVTLTATLPTLAAFASRQGIQGDHGAWFQSSAQRPGLAVTPTLPRLSAHTCIVIECPSLVQSKK